MRTTALVLVVVASACSPIRAPMPAPSDTRELTVLYTSDEHGWLAPKDDRYSRVGGAAPLLAELLDREGHCPGTVERDGVSIRPPRESCPSRTILLSGGDNYTGPALSTQLRGRSVADTMRALGYAASAFGNHELDFGREALLANRARSGVRYLAANMVRDDGSPSDLAEPYAILEQAGVRLGVVGIATESTPSVGMRQRFIGVRFDDVEATLARTIPRVWSEGADAVVVIAHECHDVMGPIVGRHPEWRLAFVGTGHCHRSAVERAGQTLMIAPSWGLSHYGRVRIRIHPSRPARERAEVVDWGLVAVTSPVEGATHRASASLDAAISGWQRQVDRELGEVVGHSLGWSASSDAMAGWLLGAWLESFPDADVAVTTRGAIRQDMPAGPVTLGTIQSILPFDNDLVVARVPVAEFAKLAVRPKSLVLGARCSDATCTRADGSPLPDMVNVVTTDFLYYGGDGYEFERFDKMARLTHTDWRAPVIEWMRRTRTTKDSPIERVLGRKR